MTVSHGGRDLLARWLVVPTKNQAIDDLLGVLRELDEMAAANIDRSHLIKERIDLLISRLEAGDRLPDIVENETLPLIPTLITENIEALQDVGSRLRKAEAAALRVDGYTMERIASLFEVSRQRVSALLRDSQ